MMLFGDAKKMVDKIVKNLCTGIDLRSGTRRTGRAAMPALLRSGRSGSACAATMTCVERGPTTATPTADPVRRFSNPGLACRQIHPIRSGLLSWRLDILDTAPEQAFDDVVQLARLLCGSPVALISLVDSDRQWFKARVGFPRCETDLNSSVCVYALSEPDLLVIPDLTADPRTCRNPLVTGDPHIRFYAGAPLRMPSGRVLGSLCVLDHQPRPGGLTEDQADGLRRLARQVTTLIDERRQIALVKAEEIYARAASLRRAALIELGDFLRNEASIPAMTHRAAEIVGRTLDASRTGYGELDAAGEHITIHRDWTTVGSDSLVGRHRFMDHETLGPCLSRGETLVVDAVAEDPRTVETAALLSADQCRRDAQRPGARARVAASACSSCTARRRARGGTRRSPSSATSRIASRWASRACGPRSSRRCSIARSAIA